MSTLKPARKPAGRPAARLAAKPAARSALKGAAAPQRTGLREQAAQATQDAILKAAIKVFAKDGFAGGRVEEISRLAKSYDRMIYYYFGSKESLFIAVIEETYRRFNEAESHLALDLSQPEKALRDIIAFIWTYYQKHPEFITLLNSENLHRGRHIARTNRAGEYSSPALSVLGQVLDSGVRSGVFRQGLRARDIYLMIAAMGYFYLSNRFTLSAFLGENLEEPAALDHWQAFIADAVLRTVSQPAVAGTRSVPQPERKPHG